MGSNHGTGESMTENAYAPVLRMTSEEIRATFEQAGGTPTQWQAHCAHWFPLGSGPVYMLTQKPLDTILAKARVQTLCAFHGLAMRNGKCTLAACNGGAP